jgi:hypothetical protein
MASFLHSGVRPAAPGWLLLALLGSSPSLGAGRPPPAVETGSAPVSFRREVVAFLTRAGCNSGTCHGTPTGKNGFRLSLRGFDPALDHQALTRESGGRRVNRIEPGRSLILEKATGQVAHQGGRRFEPGGAAARLVERWIAEGAGDDGDPLPALSGLETEPAQAVLRRPAWSAELRVFARFEDGSRREVTGLARFSVSDEKTAQVSAEGRVEGRERGEVAAAAEYLTRVAAARLTFIEAGPAPAWPDPPEENFIDHHLFQKLRLLGIPPSDLSSDEEFLRRASLDAAGMLPEPEETRRFLADPAPDKRVRLIDRLLERPESVQIWTMRYADRLGVNQRFVGQKGAYKYYSWLSAAMAANLPEDQLARAILTASGGNYSHPAAGFYRRLRDPEAAAENVSQIFLGVRLQCARCHNHPGDRWTQDDYQGMAAFFAGLRFKDGPFFNHLYDKEETVFLDRSAELKHPRTGAVVAPRFLGGERAAVTPGEDRREALAAWLTGPRNPYFARVAVNRIWYHLFGRGIVEPVDDFRETNPPASEPLLRALADDFTAHGFDRRRLIRAIMTSRAYQLSSHPTALNAADEKYFSHARVRLLGAEVLLDAISAAAGVPERFEGLPLGYRAAQLPDGEYTHRFLTAFGRPARAMACECERDGESSISQALELVGGPAVQGKVHSEKGRVARLLESGRGPRELVEELFLAALTRFPTAEEVKLLSARLEDPAGRRAAAEDLLWALLNHPEFLYQH